MGTVMRGESIQASTNKDAFDRQTQSGRGSRQTISKHSPRAIMCQAAEKENGGRSRPVATACGLLAGREATQENGKFPGFCARSSKTHAQATILWNLSWWRKLKNGSRENVSQAICSLAIRTRTGIGFWSHKPLEKLAETKSLGACVVCFA